MPDDPPCVTDISMFVFLDTVIIFAPDPLHIFLPEALAVLPVNKDVAPALPEQAGLDSVWLTIHPITTILSWLPVLIVVDMVYVLVDDAVLSPVFPPRYSALPISLMFAAIVSNVASAAVFTPFALMAAATAVLPSATDFPKSAILLFICIDSKKTPD